MWERAHAEPNFFPSVALTFSFHRPGWSIVAVLLSLLQQITETDKTSLVYDMVVVELGASL